MDLSQKRQLDEISESMNLPSTKSVAASGNEADEFFFVLKTCINRCLMSGNLFKCVLSPLVRIYIFTGFPRIVKSTFKTFVPIINAKVKENENMIHRLFLKIKSKLQVEHIYSLSNEVSCFSTLNGITIFYSRLKSMLNYAKVINRLSLVLRLELSFVNRAQPRCLKGKNGAGIHPRRNTLKR